ncbi:hypothetical protein N7463_004462 [Penicillium fimorum]|uniref:Major facilitator superfamily (MFS) profile domain-containing protein n=1 Tax=Penicillium fimorum TaxID=1882269 RepID=A0A9X0CAZ2_9EURO|nr:hypothetical protein N7463_004462 [Penicillium fimorum]
MDPAKSRASELEEAKPLPLDQHGDLAHQQKLTRNVLWKLDIHILPILALLFLMSFLDRTNVGNAKILGLEADLSITDHQYDIGLAVFYLTYICSELPSNLVLKKASPKIWLPFLAAIWGIITMCLGFVQNFAGFVAVRALLGIAEGGLLPGMVLYLSSFYRRGDLALRIGLFYTAASLSGAFGGLLARGLAEIGPRGGIEGWRWILIIEGLLTFVCGVFSFFFLPNSLESASFLTPEEKEFGGKRLRLDRPGSLEGSREAESFRWSEVRRGVLDLQVWLSASAYFAILAGLYSFGLFLPTIIKNLNFAKDANEVQLWSVIPYAVAAVLTVVVAIISDRLRLRGVVMLFTLPVAIIGYAAIANIDSPSCSIWYDFPHGNWPICQCTVHPGVVVEQLGGTLQKSHYVSVAAGNCKCRRICFDALAFNYPARDGPLFHRGHTIILGLLVFAWFMILLNVLYCAKINRDKRNGKYDQYAGYNDDRNPEFMMVL